MLVRQLILNKKYIGLIIVRSKSSIMKTARFFAFFLLIILASCSKGNYNYDNNKKIPGEISVSVDGISTTFNSGALADTAMGSGQYGVSITGATDTSSIADNISITVGSLDPLQVGTYTQNTLNAGIDLVYTQKSTNLSYTPNAASNVIITFSTLTNTTVKGTFSGTVFLHGDSTLAKKVLTNGAFSLEF